MQAKVEIEYYVVKTEDREITFFPKHAQEITLLHIGEPIFHSHAIFIFLFFCLS